MDHNILEEVLGLDRSDLDSLSRHQRAALALEVLGSIELPDRAGQERRLGLLAREAVDDLRRYYD